MNIAVTNMSGEGIVYGLIERVLYAERLMAAVTLLLLSR